jgi:trk system potassium uptake protein TrkH
MPDLRPILHINGLFLTGLAILMLLPAAVDLADGNDDWLVFWSSAIVTGFCGLALILANRRPALALNVKQIFLLTTSAWFLMSIFAGLPFRFAKVSLTLGGSFFEAASGLTTTGATVLVGLDTMAPGILLWRGLLNLFGGYGIIVMAIAILPFLGVGGMQLLKSESSDTMDKILPRARQNVIATGVIYLILNLACALGYYWGGMTGFDALVHAMATIATGGFSTSDKSLGNWPGEIVLWNAVVFMFLGALPFGLYLRALRGHWRELFADQQVRLLFGITVVAVGTTALWLVAKQNFAAWEAVRQSALNIVSITSTTGFISTDYTLWGSYPQVVFALILSIGGCTGSTSGGIKMMRFVVIWELIKTHLRRAVTPHGVFQHRFNGKPVPPDITSSVVAFFFAYLGTLLVFTVILCALGFDLVTSYSAVAACMANAGPGLGPIVGPVGTYLPLGEAAHWALGVAMILGRLELFTVLVLFTRHFWRA